MHSKYVGPLCSKIFFFCLCFSVALFTHRLSFFSVCCFTITGHHSLCHWFAWVQSGTHQNRPQPLCLSRFFTFSVLIFLFTENSFLLKAAWEKIWPQFFCFFVFLWSIHAFTPLWVPLGTTPFYLQPRAQPLQCIPACAIPSNQRFLFLQPDCVSFFQEWETCDWFCMYSLCRVWGRSDGSNWGSFVRQCGW